MGHTDSPVWLLHREDYLFPFYFLLNPLCGGLGVNLFLFLIKDGNDFFLGICKVFVALICGIEIKLADLMCF